MANDLVRRLLVQITRQSLIIISHFIVSFLSALNIRKSRFVYMHQHIKHTQKIMFFNDFVLLHIQFHEHPAFVANTDKNQII